MVKTKKNYTKKNQVNGALPSSANSIAAMLGESAFPYKELTLAEYRKKLDGMDLSDLQKHAIEIAQILPNVASRAVLIDKLERAYLSKQALFIPQSVGSKQMTTEQEAEMRRLLSR